jgi:hypothetical protein
MNLLQWKMTKSNFHQMQIDKCPTEHHVLDINAEKQLSSAATDVLLTHVLKKEQHLNKD